MPRANKELRAGVGCERAPVPLRITTAPAALSTDEELVLHALLACETGRTAWQLAAGSGLTREQVANVLQDLRAKGLVTRLNTVVASYAARFPGIRVSEGPPRTVLTDFGEDQDGKA